jgi:6-phosphogluconate dehydrogenase
MENNLFDFGMIGLGTMGRNLLLNMADHGFKAIGFDLDPEKGKLLETSATAGTTVKGVNTLAEMVKQLAVPRKIMMLVPAGKPVDDVINSLLPLVSPGDIIIDGGNSHYTDTIRRVNSVREKGFHFMGIGISGGEHGARTGQYHAGWRSGSLCPGKTDSGGSSRQSKRQRLCSPPGKRRRRSLRENGS